MSNIHPTILLFVGLATAFATPAKFDYVKEGASAFQKERSISECSYQIVLHKNSPAAQAQLLHICMQGKGYRYRQVA